MSKECFICLEVDNTTVSKVFVCECIHHCHLKCLQQCINCPYCGQTGRVLMHNQDRTDELRQIIHNNPNLNNNIYNRIIDYNRRNVSICLCFVFIFGGLVIYVNNFM